MCQSKSFFQSCFLLSWNFIHWINEENKIQTLKTKLCNVYCCLTPCQYWRACQKSCTQPLSYSKIMELYRSKRLCIMNYFYEIYTLYFLFFFSTSKVSVSHCHMSHALQSLLSDFFRIITVNLYSRSDVLDAHGRQINDYPGFSREDQEWPRIHVQWQNEYTG